jgi:LAO/AO transport system kinase
LSALAAVAAAGKAGLARALGRLEGAPDDAATLALLDEAYRAPRAHVVGITGPPGVGKSTLLGVLIAAWRRGDPARTVGVIAVDPSSRASGGALLGDRLRLNTDPDDAGVFVRSMAARDRLGGLAPVTVAAMVLMRALYDVVAIETVGVGQSEADVVDAADTVVFCIQPGSGDSLQFMKAGIVELPHVMAVTKADTGAAARRAVSEAAGALGLAVGRAEGWTVPVLPVSAQRREGIDALLAAVDGHWRHLADGRLAALRDAQATAWLRAAVRERFGRDGLGRAGELGLDRQSPFARMAALGRTLAH